MDPLARSHLTRWTAPVAGAAAGLCAAVTIAASPPGAAESLVARTGVVTLGPTPLGPAAVTLVALCGGAFIAAAIWSSLYLLVGPEGLVSAVQARRAAQRSMVPLLPLSEFGAPLAERQLPADLDQPLAAFDPNAVPAEPREPSRALPSLALGKGERFSVIELPIGGGDEPSIEALLRRLELAARGPA